MQITIYWLTTEDHSGTTTLLFSHATDLYAALSDWMLEMLDTDEHRESKVAKRLEADEDPSLLYDSFIELTGGNNFYAWHGEQEVTLDDSPATTLLTRAVTEWPQFSEGGYVDGRKLHDWFGKFRQSAKELLAGAPATPTTPTDAQAAGAELLAAAYYVDEVWERGGLAEAVNALRRAADAAHPYLALPATPPAAATPGLKPFTIVLKCNCGCDDSNQIHHVSATDSNEAVKGFLDAADDDESRPGRDHLDVIAVFPGHQTEAPWE
jgi:hypothetical protein